MTTWQKKATMILGMVFVGIAAYLAGCNTIEGAGEDVSAVGDTVSDTSRDVRD